MRTLDLVIPFFKKRTKIELFENYENSLTIIGHEISSNNYTVILFSKNPAHKTFKPLVVKGKDQMEQVDIKKYDSFQVERSAPGLKYRMRAIIR